MLDIKFIRKNIELVKKNCKHRLVKCDIEKLLEKDKERRLLEATIDKLRAEKNKYSKTKPTEDVIAKMKPIGQEIKDLEVRQRQVMIDYAKLLNQIPNLALADVPVGKDENDNKVIRLVGKIPKFNFKPKEHWQLGEELDLIDITRASKVSGSRFNYLKGELALMEFALIQYALAVLTNEKILNRIIKSNKLKVAAKPFMPVVPPVLIKPEVFQKMARLEPKEERYYIPSDDIYLIGSAEHTLGAMHLDESFGEHDLPIRYVGFSAAFRREAGSYGKDLKGILRMHQFDKIEMESFTLPENSLAEQNFFIAIQEYLMQSFNIPYRIVIICTGDMSAPDARQTDLECWLPGQNKYRETHTADLMTDYQSRRLNTKVKLNNGKTEYVHMNDATVLAIGRTLVAIMENYQQADGSIIIPEVLRKYLPNNLKLIKKHN